MSSDDLWSWAGGGGFTGSDRKVDFRTRNGPGRYLSSSHTHCRKRGRHHPTSLIDTQGGSAKDRARDNHQASYDTRIIIQLPRGKIRCATQAQLSPLTGTQPTGIGALTPHNVYPLFIAGPLTLI